jgi:hypothetical protein
MRTSLLFVACLSAQFLTAQAVWEEETSCPGNGRYWAFAVTLDGKGYAGTGQSSETDLLSDLWAYDPATDTWQQKADHPGAKAGVTAWVANGRLFAGFGTAGAGPTSNLYEYLPASDSWVTRLGVQGGGFAYAAGFAIGNTLYVGPESGSNTMRAYDVVSGQWSTVAAFPGLWRSYHTAFVVDGKGYMGGGRTENDEVLSDWWSYDPLTDTWSSIAALQPGTDESSACTVNGMGYVLNAGSGQGDLFRYDPVGDQWVPEGGLPIYRLSRGSMFSIGDKGYHAFGLKRVLANLVPSSELWSFSPTVGIAEEGALMAISTRYEADGSVWLTSDHVVPSGALLQVQDAAGRILEQRNLTAGVPLQVRITPNGRAPGLHLVSIRSSEGPVVCRVFL